MQSILNSQEFEVYDSLEASVLETSDGIMPDKLKKLVKLSLIPKCESHKFHLLDGAKDINLELRCLPPLELFVAIPESYPSSSPPLFLITHTIESNVLFYEPMRTFLYERLLEKWSEDNIVLYESVVFIQDELISSFLESDAFAAASSRFKLCPNDPKVVEIKYQSG